LIRAALPLSTNVQAATLTASSNRPIYSMFRPAPTGRLGWRISLWTLAAPSFHKLSDISCQPFLRWAEFAHCEMNTRGVPDRRIGAEQTSQGLAPLAPVPLWAEGPLIAGEGEKGAWWEASWSPNESLVSSVGTGARSGRMFWLRPKAGLGC